MTLTRRQTVELLAEHGLRPSRALGQNFVADPNTVRRIARLAEVGPGDQVVEIGAGLGSLTLALAETGARVTAVEVDRHLVPVLRGDRGARRGDGRRGRRPGARLGGLLGTVARFVDTGRQPALQHRHPPGGGPARRGPCHRPDAGHGPTGGRGAAGRRRRVRCLRRGVGEGRVLGDGQGRGPGAGQRVRPPPGGRVGVGRTSGVGPSRRWTRPWCPRGAVRAGQGRIRPAPQDAAAVARRPASWAADFACAQIAPTARAEELDVAAWGRLAGCRRRRGLD